MIRSIRLTNFKNYASLSRSFNDGFNFLVGKNGLGKTNLLDALHYMCLTKSFVTRRDVQIVKFKEPFFRIEATVKRLGAEHEIVAKVQPGSIKSFSLDGSPYERLRDHVGFIPAVVLSPKDQALIAGTASERRRFIDVCLCQSDRDYFQNLMNYNRLLSQRNAHLKAHKQNSDPKLLIAYSEKMANPATQVFEGRQNFISEIIPLISQHYAHLSAQDVGTDLKYISHLQDKSFLKRAQDTLQRDCILGRTTHGVHADNFVVELDNIDLRQFGSQGQIKSMLIALHLAQFEHLKNSGEVTPVFLLDDIFDKLDEERMHNLVSLLNSDLVGQVFLTDAIPERAIEIAKNYQGNATIHHITNGKLE